MKKNRDIFDIEFSPPHQRENIISIVIVFGIVIFIAGLVYSFNHYYDHVEVTKTGTVLGDKIEKFEDEHIDINIPKEFSLSDTSYIPSSSNTLDNIISKTIFISSSKNIEIDISIYSYDKDVSLSEISQDINSNNKINNGDLILDYSQKSSLDLEIESIITIDKQSVFIKEKLLKIISKDKIFVYQIELRSATTDQKKCQEIGENLFKNISIKP